MYKKKTVFISASSSGIGYHLAKEYKSIGYNVIINGKNIYKLKKASVSLDKCSYFLGDLTDKKKIKVTIKKIKKKYKYIDVLICNLGSSNFQDLIIVKNALAKIKSLENGAPICIGTC